MILKIYIVKASSENTAMSFQFKNGVIAIVAYENNLVGSSRMTQGQCGSDCLSDIFNPY